MSLATGNTKSIKPIDAKSVHQITSGQVVIDLQTAVKELVENSLDAGATSIEVRFKNYGLNSVEVIDNGSGIPESDFEDIGRKHHTSKLSSFEDLTSITSFGFRGEAMSSLCALCESVTVTTAVAGKAPMGTVLELGKDGEVMKKGKAPRQRGTTVMIIAPFVSLPVRRKELERNIKREFGKALTLLNAYALGPCCGLSAASSEEDPSEGDVRTRAVRLVVTNQPDKGQKTTCISLPLPSPAGISPSVRNGVTILWGGKALDNVIDFSFQFQVPRLSVKRYKRKAEADEEEETFIVRVKGLISSPVPIPGSNSNSRFARTAADRQFFYINGRPCTLPKAQKALNEIYRSYSASNSAVPHFPLVIVDFNLPGDAVDVNVTPDKRTVVVHAETHIVDGLRTALDDLFSPTRSTYGVNGTQSSGITKSSQNNSIPQSTPQRTVSMPASTNDSDQDESDKDISPVKNIGRLGRSRTAFTTFQGREARSAAATTTSTVKSTFGPGSADRQTPPRLHFGTRPLDGTDLQVPPVSPTNGEIGVKHSVPFPPPLPHHRDAVASEGQAIVVSAGSGTRKTPGEVVVSTVGASWTQKVGPSAQKDLCFGRDSQSDPREDPSDEVEPPRKKQKSIAVSAESNDEEMEDLEIRPTDHTRSGRRSPVNVRKDESARQPKLTDIFQPRNNANARQSMRSRLAGFARAGSQLSAPPTEEEEDEEIRDQVQEDVESPARLGESVAKDASSSSSSSSKPLPLFLPDEDGDVPMEDSTSASASSVVGSATSASVSNPPTSSSVLPNSSSSSAVIDLSLDSDEEEIDGSLLSSINPEAMTQSRKLEQVDRPEVIRTTSSQTSDDVHLRFNISEITERWSILQEKLKLVKSRRQARYTDTATDASTTSAAFAAAGTGAGGRSLSMMDDSDKAAEATLSRVIEKTDFSKMDVLGQFNLGFIIVRKRGKGSGTCGESASRELDDIDQQDDLFIVDQHAADEKYNFETLQETCRIKSQRLFRPLTLDLTVADEILAMENMEVLRRNGFELHVRDDANDGDVDHNTEEEHDMERSRNRLSLAALPISKGTVFDLKDLEELLHLLHDSPSGTMVRCSKARAMFASRACRKSVMVGMPLTRAQMTAVVHHMGKMDQPWNCPHGRPTMRHLFDMSTKLRMQFKEVDWASFT